VKFGPRLRAIVDDSSKTKKGVVTGHGSAEGPETQATKRLVKSTGSNKDVTRTHFRNLQHNKIFIAKRDGKPFKVLTGSTNFSFRGLYIQANNVLVFDDPSVADLYAQVFELAFTDPASFAASDVAKRWHTVAVAGRRSNSASRRTRTTSCRSVRSPPRSIRRRLPCSTRSHSSIRSSRARRRRASTTSSAGRSSAMAWSTRAETSR